MKLGIIAPALEESFQMAQHRGLHFLELCINEGDDVGAFYQMRSELMEWRDKYQINIESIGRWKSLRIDDKGAILPDELERCFQLIDVASELNCPSFVAGCNYVEQLSLYDNCTAAIRFFEQLLAYAAPKNVKVSTYNCRKVNFVNTPEIWNIVHGHLPDLGIKYDPSHARFSGGNYLEETFNWGHRFYHVHLKGSLVLHGQKVDEPPAGLDQTDWRSFLGLLRAAGYKGGLSIEPRKSALPAELDSKGIDYSVAYFKQLLLEQSFSMG
ncbi:sugar phosphate isomerase/epimerase [Paenibacillus cellulosilyticus]|uniref:Sugar phosphate isomerase/epimerase n=1 Tax=Paenibacillus cellulosilyticus TaxID=375489 RepID=A0A2V2YNC8_9BACL|nr:sugar phosphate isomerase/epimerase [Paenibacillus cellulosilyticus]PWV90593.1 sugar phosphate isomerase/epimerase [Paenibacillus cellulosilyticus]QKS45242.1 sugar phosphate isomerase/epimerase [Paenibacillus cellulosilyticus]